MTCGGGIKTRTRHCLGDVCVVGDLVEAVTCNLEPCQPKILIATGYPLGSAGNHVELLDLNTFNN